VGEWAVVKHKRALKDRSSEKGLGGIHQKKTEGKGLSRTGGPLGKRKRGAKIAKPMLT